MGNHDESGQAAGGDDARLSYETARELERQFIEACREARERRGWSQRELARQMGIRGLGLHQSSIAKLERGTEDRRPLALAEAIALGRTLEVDLVPFVTGNAAAEGAEHARQLEERWDAVWDYIFQVDTLVEMLQMNQNHLQVRFSDAPGRIGQWGRGELLGLHPRHERDDADG